MICPDCKGRRRIVLAISEVDCETCGATGSVSDTPAFYADPLGVGESTCQFGPGIDLTFNKPRNTNRTLCPVRIDHAAGKFVVSSRGIDFRFEFMEGPITDFDSVGGMRYYLLELGRTRVVGIDAVILCRDSLWIGRNYTFSLVSDACGVLTTFAQESP